MSRRHPEFYVGYAERAPAGLAAFTRRIVMLLAAAVAVVFFVVASFQQSQPTGVFEFGRTRTFEGVLYEAPVPVLRMAGGVDGPAAAAVELLLVGFGKQGLPEFASGHDGRRVRFDGTLIYREDAAMIEMNDPASFTVLGDPEPGEGRRRSGVVGPVDLTGEIVDTKCFLGVMRPATGKVHRACAVRCISGGIPAGLLVRGRDGRQRVYVLAGPPGGSLELDPQWAGRTIAARGRIEFGDGAPVLRVESMQLR